MLCVQNLTKTFTSGWPWSKQTSYTAVKDVSFQLKAGEILGFLGSNGAGKTTTMQMLLGNLTPTSGTINYFNQEFGKNQIQILKRIGYASGYDRLPARLSVYENLEIVARIYGLNSAQRSARIKELLQSFGIVEYINCQTGLLSAGQATRVLLAKAFIAHPEIVILDEPTASLDPDVADEVRKFILMQRQLYGTAILVTSHNMAEVTELCDRVIVIKQGAIIANDTPAVLIESISQTRLNLRISVGSEQVIKQLKTTQLNFVQQAHDYFIIEINEHQIAPLLIELGRQDVVYTYISIDKPTLEQYFLSITRQNPASKI